MCVWRMKFSIPIQLSDIAYFSFQYGLFVGKLSLDDIKFIVSLICLLKFHFITKKKSSLNLSKSHLKSVKEPHVAPEPQVGDP